MTSLYDANLNQKRKYKTLDNTKDTFPIGTRVRVICVCQDFHFFNPEKQNTYGTVIGNDNISYTSIKVKWEVPRIYADGNGNDKYIQEHFYFSPSDLTLDNRGIVTTEDELIVYFLDSIVGEYLNEQNFRN